MHPALVGFLKSKNFIETEDGKVDYYDPTFNHPSIHYFIAKKGVIQRERSKRKKAVWQKYKDLYYVTCLVKGCGEINGVEEEVMSIELMTSIGRGILTKVCIVCRKCSSHNFFFLKGAP